MYQTLRVVLVLLLMIVLSVENIIAVICFQLNYPDFPSPGTNLTLLATGSCSTKYSKLYPSLRVSYVQLIADPKDEEFTVSRDCSVINRVVYGDPIPLLNMVNDTPIAVSFNTSFQFQLISSGETVWNDYGMAFFIASSLAAPNNSVGDFFGLVSDTSTGNPLLALEFDTHENDDVLVNDPSYSHIAVDIGSISSSTVLDTSNYSSNFDPKLNLNSNYTFSVWMSFNASSQEINVWMTNDTTTFQVSSADPPTLAHTLVNPVITLQIHNDLLSKLFTPYMFVGFSAAANYDAYWSSTEIGVNILKWFMSVDPTSNIASKCTTNSFKSSDKPATATATTLHSKFVVALVAMGVLLLALIATSFGLVYYIRKQRHRSESPNLEQVDVNHINLRRYTYRELQECTHNFNEKTSLIGEGGFSRVYKGTLPDGSIVAIKRLKEGLRMEAEFATELKIISNIRHRNLLQLQGWSYENGEASLVYKFMSNGSLEAYLHGARKGTLDGHRPLRILAGVAAALEYLHCGLGECILHRDVKAANVLLTDDFEPVLGDFGLARLIKHNQVVTATRAGTPGFIAPEVIMTGKVTDKADVYSFGVLMLEVASGSQAISFSALEQPDQHLYLVDWVKELQQSNNSIDNMQQVIDPSILQLTSGLAASIIEGQWKKVLHLALICCHSSPEHRPEMKYVSQSIQEIITYAENGTLPTQL